MHKYWSDSFPPEQLWRWPAWFLDVHAGNLLAYPVGGKHGASALSLGLFVLGTLTLWRQRRYQLLGLCLIPFTLTLLAAILDKYPYGGSARIAQHLAPAICLLIGVGAYALLERLRSIEQQQRWAFGISVLLAGYGLGGLAWDWVAPYKTFHDHEVRRFTRELGAQLQPGDTILVCNHPDDVHSHMAWYLRNEKCPARWLGQSGEANATAGRVWVLFFDLRPASAERVLSLVQNQYPAWTPDGCRHFYLPAENRVAQDWFCTWFCLRRAPIEPASWLAE